MQYPQEQVTLSEAIQSLIDAHMLEVNVSLPCQVDSYDAATQTVSVVPHINVMVPDGATPPNYVSETLPKLTDIPVAHMRGGGFFAAFPITKGDYGMLVFADHSLATWRATGNQTDPGDLGRHGLDGAWFIPAVAPDAQVLNNADGTNLVIGSDSSPDARIVIKPSGEIGLGANTASYVARADKVVTHLTAILNLLATAPTVPVEAGLIAVKAAAVTLLAQGFLDVPTTNTKVP